MSVSFGSNYLTAIAWSQRLKYRVVGDIPCDLSLKNVLRDLSIRVSFLVIYTIVSPITLIPDMLNLNPPTLDLSRNRLTQASDVSQNANLRTLDLTRNQLIEAPDVRQNPNLRDLDLSYNQLTQAPDLSHNRNLQTLSLGDNRLTQAPDVRRNPNLRILDISYNQLTQAPDVSHNTKLQTLYLHCNGLIQAPDLSQNTDLKELKLGDNQLTQAPDLRHNRNLQILTLGDNRLTLAPDVSHNTKLAELYLKDNRLTLAPDLSQNTDLKELNLGDNRLTLAPDVSHNTKLQTIYLQNNLLTTLPDSILTLSNTCQVNAQNNRFSAEYVAQFQARLAAQRVLDPTTGPRVHISIYDAAADAVAAHSLETELGIWSVGLNPPIDWSPLTQMDQENRTLLLNYLTKLKETADYRGEGSRGAIIARAQTMLRLACENGAFKEELLALMLEGSRSCGDRVILLFNDIEVLSQRFLRNYSELEFAKLAIKIQRYALLKVHAKRQAEQRSLGDEVETTLYYQIRLKEALCLPITTEGMLYPAMAGVTEAMLLAAKSEIEALSKLDLLAGSDLWRARLEKESPAIFAAIKEQNDERLGNLSENLQDQEYRNQCEQIQANREAQLTQAARELTVQKGLQLA